MAALVLGPTLPRCEPALPLLSGPVRQPLACCWFARLLFRCPDELRRLSFALPAAERVLPFRKIFALPLCNPLRAVSNLMVRNKTGSVSSNSDQGGS